MSFTDPEIVPAVTPVRAVHFTELRTRIDGLRTAVGLGGFAWTDPVLTAGVTPVRLVHLLELRSALAAAYAEAGQAAPRWTDAAPVGGTTPDPGRAPDGATRRGAAAGVSRRGHGAVCGRFAYMVVGECTQDEEEPIEPAGAASSRTRAPKLTQEPVIRPREGSDF